MSARLLLRLLLGYCVLLALAAVGMYRYMRSEPSREHRTIVSVWQRGRRVARAVTAAEPRSVKLVEADAPGSTTVFEHVQSEGRVIAWGRALFCFSFGNGRDGVHARYAGRDAYLTRDDLLRQSAYGIMMYVGTIPLRCSIDANKVLALLGSQLGVSADELWRHGSFTRFTVRREVPGAALENDFAFTPDGLRKAALAGARYLARNLHADGTFRYEVDARTNTDIEGYNWPRHGGATLFLAEAASFSHAPDLMDAARRAARRLAEQTTLTCGAHRCIGEGDRVDLGSSALALLAYAEMVKGHVDDSFQRPVAELAEFLRSMQRPDGEFMHIYDRAQNRPIDVQYAYYTGEAALALARVYHITHDRKDFEAARAALAYTANKRWTFFGSRYWFDYEHWTCQAMAELWDEAPDYGALDLCVHWHRFNRASQLESRALGDFDGGFTDPLTPPRIAVAGSRTEGAVATLMVLRKANVPASEVAALTRQIERAFALMLRYQLTPGPAFLFADPAAMYGAFPGSPVDYTIRIDYPQHVGAGMLRYADLMKGER